MRYLNYYDSPLGALEVVTDEKNLLEIKFVEKKSMKESEKTTVFLQVEKELNEYFLGKREKFSVPFILNGTEFQKKVWIEVNNIPYGETKSYKEIAKNIGNEKAVRAVGNANNRNKLPIIIPCHRVIGSSGNLVGYGGGLSKKIYLLELEEKNV